MTKRKKKWRDLPPEEAAKRFTEFRESETWKNLMKVVEDYNEKWDPRVDGVAGDGGSFERFLIELHHETGLDYDRLNNMGEDELSAIADAVIQRRFGGKQGDPRTDDPDVADKQHGLELWNGGSSWREVNASLGRPDVASEIKATTEEIRRFAEATKQGIRKGRPGAKKKA